MHHFFIIFSFFKCILSGETVLSYLPVPRLSVTLLCSSLAPLSDPQGTLGVHTLAFSAPTQHWDP